MGEVADLWAAIGARLDARAWAAADARIRAAGLGLDGVGKRARGAGTASAKAAGQAGAAWAAVKAQAAGALAFLGIKVGTQALIGFNATAEESRNQIAGMMALAKKSDLSAELGTADALMESLRKRAAALPGTTSEYIAMLGDITQPIIDAKLSTQDLEDMTVAAVVAAKALRVEAGAAARDVGQAIRGQFQAEDQLTGKLLGARGFKGEEGRQRFNALSEKERARILKEVLTSKQMLQLAEAQGNTFSGVMSTLKDAAEQFFGRIGKPLFKALGDAIRGANKWLDEHKELVQSIADTVGGALVAAFDAIGAAFGFLRENLDLVVAILLPIAGIFLGIKVAAAAAWLAALGPIALIVAAIAAVVYFIIKLAREPEKVKAAFRRLWEYIKAGVRGFVEQAKALANAAWEGFKAVGDRIRTFFVDDIPNAIKSAFKAAFEWVSNLPVVKQIFDAVRWAQRTVAGAAIIGGPAAGVNRALQSAPMLPPSTTGPVSSVSVGDTTVGITVNAAPGMNEQALAAAAGKEFDNRMAALVRQSMDRL